MTAIHVQKAAESFTTAVFLDIKARKSFTMAVFMVIKAAFDSVAHKAVGRDMAFIRLRSRMHAWLSNYVNNWYLYMTTKDGETTRHAITQDVSQGGVLSLTRFSICLIHIANVLLRGFKQNPHK